MCDVAGSDVIPELENIEPFAVTLKVRIRLCRREDLPTLEWFGLFTPERDLIDATFESQERGEAIMLVAEANGVASGQLWIDLKRKEVDATGVLWASRVFPCLQNLGIGARMFLAAERILRNRGFRRAELEVERNNVGARRLYERLGYHEVRGVQEGVGERWLLRKDLLQQVETADAGERGRHA